MEKNKIISVTVHYNGEEYIENHIDSLLENQIDKIIVIDNNSTDKGIEKLNLRENDIFFQNYKNKGFAKACNQGIREAINYQPDFILVVNQDVFLLPDTIEKLLIKAKLKNHAFYSPMHFFKKDQYDKAFAFYIKDQKFKDKGAELDFVNAACWLIPIEVFLKIGIFDPLFFFTGEDIDFCNRARYFGMNGLVVENSIIYHKRKSDKNLADINNPIFIHSTKADYIHNLKNINKSIPYCVLSCVKRAIRLSFNNNFSLRPWSILLGVLLDKKVYKHRVISKTQKAFL